MGGLSSLQSGINSLSGGLAKTLEFAEGVLGNAASIHSSVNALQEKAASSILPPAPPPKKGGGKKSAGQAPTGAIALTGPIGAAPAASSSSTPTLLLFVAALVVVVLIARK